MEVAMIGLVQTTFAEAFGDRIVNINPNGAPAHFWVGSISIWLTPGSVDAHAMCVDTESGEVTELVLRMGIWTPSPLSHGSMPLPKRLWEASAALEELSPDGQLLH